MNVDFQNTVLFLNRRCAVGCPSCNVSAAADRVEELSPVWLMDFFARARDLDFAGFVTWTGGEPFLSFESLTAGIELAGDTGFRSEILTSGIWYRDEPGLLEEIAGFEGVSLRVSVDAEHQRSVAVGQLISLLSRADELAIETNLTLRDIPGDPEAVKRMMAVIEDALPEFMEKNHNRSRFCNRIPHMPLNNPNHPLQCLSGQSSNNKKWQKRCDLGFRDLVVGEDGIVYPCCGVIGLDCRPSFAIGDPLLLSWKELLRRRDEHPLLDDLRGQGPLQMARRAGLDPEQWNTRFQTPCHLCLTLFTHFPDKMLKHCRGAL